MNDKYIVGIDIGSSNIHGTVGMIDKNRKLKILSSCVVKSNGIEKGEVIGIDSLSKSIRSCISQMEAEIDMYIDEVYVGIPTGRCRFVSSTGISIITDDDYEISYDDVSKAIKNASDIKLSIHDRIVEIIPLDYQIDEKVNIKNPIGMKGERLQVNIKAAIADDIYINNIYKAIEKCGVKVLKTLTQAQAAATILLRDEDLDSTIALIDIGAYSSDITVYKNNKIIDSKSISLGGDNITSDISYCFKIPKCDCEYIKLDFNNMVNKEKKIEFKDKYEHKTELDIEMLYDVIYARVEEILELTLKKLKDLESYHSIDNILIYGGGVSYFKLANNIGKKLDEKPIFIINNHTLNLENTLTINTLGIVKYMYNEVKLKGKDMTLESSISDKHEVNNNMSRISKIKKFLKEYF